MNICAVVMLVIAIVTGSFLCVFAEGDVGTSNVNATKAASENRDNTSEDFVAEPLSNLKSDKAVKSLEYIPYLPDTVVTEVDGIKYSVKLGLRDISIKRDEIKDLDESEALKYIVGKSIFFYSTDDELPTELPMLGRDYYAGIESQIGYGFVTPGIHTLYVSAYPFLFGAIHSKVTVQDAGNHGAENSNSEEPQIMPKNNVKSPAPEPAGTLKAYPRPEAKADKIADYDIENGMEASESTDAENADKSYARGIRGLASRADNSWNQERIIKAAVKTASAGAGLNSAWLIVLIISDIKILLWYRRRKRGQAEEVSRLA